MTEKIFSCEQRKGFIRSSVLIRQDTDRDRIDYIYLNHAHYGTLEWNKGWKKIHRWEDEDEAQDFSSMNKHFTAISTDGTPAHPQFERAMLDAISADIIEFGTDEEASIFLPVISTLRNDSKSTVITQLHHKNN